jgi:hypothetical protein
VTTVKDGSAARPLLLDAAQPRGELAVHPTACVVCGQTPTPDEVQQALEKIETALRFQRNNIEPTGDEGVEYMLALMTLRRALAGECECPAQAQDVVRTMMEGKNG